MLTPEQGPSQRDRRGSVRPARSTEQRSLAGIFGNEIPEGSSLRAQWNLLQVRKHELLVNETAADIVVAVPSTSTNHALGMAELIVEARRS